MAGITYPKTIIDKINGSKDNDDIVVGGLYRHFKGGLYQVIGFSKWEKDLTTFVLYRSLLDGNVWARDIDSFTDYVDSEKYPEFAGQKRLQLVGYPEYLTK